MRSVRGCMLIASLLVTLVLAGDPKVKKSPFDYTPQKFYYLDDSSVILSLNADKKQVQISTDDGVSWETVQVVAQKAIDLVLHPFNKQRAIIIGNENVHWATDNKGNTWEAFTIPKKIVATYLSFHAIEADYVMFAGRGCEPDKLFGHVCGEITYYTKDWFKTVVKLRGGTHRCIFAQGAVHFRKSQKSTILCVVDGEDKFREHRKLVTSNDFFQTQTEPKLDGYNVIKGVVAIAAAQKFIVAAVRSAGSEELALFVTDDAEIWDRAEFPHAHEGLRQDAYTLLESTPYSIQIDVLSGDATNPVGGLYTSNSNGTYFTKNLDSTNRIQKGLVDFEQIEGIEGIVLANIVANAPHLKEWPLGEKRLQSRISFDDGRMGTWKPLKLGNEDLHLHSVTKLARLGRIFSSAAPGILIGIGNTGEYLEKYKEGSLFVSDDAGLTWLKSRNETSTYRVGGSGSIIVAVNDQVPTKQVFFSVNHGKTWGDVDLPETVHVRDLITAPDSTSLKFVLIAIEQSNKNCSVYSLDFSDVFDRTCKMDKQTPQNSDFEQWYARLDEDKKPDCLMGHKQFYWRKKKDAHCKVDNLFKEPQDEKEDCDCQDHDFECDFNFIKSRDGKCELAPGASLPNRPDACKIPGDKFHGPSGYRKVPGNTCKQGIEEEKLAPVLRECPSSPSKGDIKATSFEFKARNPARYFYLENAQLATKPDETIIMQTNPQRIWISHDGGMIWESPKELENVQVVNIYPHTSNFNHVYLTTPTDDVWFTSDRGRNFIKIKAPAPPYLAPQNMPEVPTLEFHPENDKWLIWAGQKDCDSPTKCHAIAYYTKDKDDETGWKAMKSHVGKCKWIRGQKQLVYSENLIFCEVITKNLDRISIQLVSSENFFDAETVHFKNIKGFAKMEEFIVVASVNEEDGYLKAFASVNGKTFAHAQFPHNFNVPHETAYTVLDSVTHAIFLHVTVNEREGFKYGSLLKSNSNGTDYVVSLDAVNRNRRGFVDFEKMHSIEGVILANRVINWQAAVNGEKKKLRTMISHNDGSEWKYIAPPMKDSEGKLYECRDEECSLNLHHYTERSDPRHTFASVSGVGLMLGVGNVGNYLSGFAEGNTFLTRDGGLEWKEVRKGPHFWEYGDQGSVIVIVDRMKETDTVYYTLDEGRNWNPYNFGKKMFVRDISTMPTDTSRRFLLWGVTVGKGDVFYTVHLDFTGITTQQCQFDVKNPDGGDFYQWKYPGDDSRCLFGHVTLYNRKRFDHRCYIGQTIPKIHKTLHNCSCTRVDYECDFNYERATEGSCQLIEGLEKPNHSNVCQDKDTVEYYEPTGYRRLPMTTCEGEPEKFQGRSKPCPGREEQYKKKHPGISGAGLLFAVLCSIAGAVGVGYYIWWWIIDRPLGTIRLGEDYENRFVQYPIIVISVIVTIMTAIPQFVSQLGFWLATTLTRTRRYTTRSSFARGDYSIVNNEEGELLGSDDEDDV